MSEWNPIETIPEGKHALLWFPQGEKGIGGMECGTCFWDERHDPKANSIHVYEKWLSKWTHGGPNSGLDFETSNCEMPTHWMPLPEPPK
jgi:hypothetical protein